jgi:DNA helicase II / ATP-dependent DNA helicase PcrA
LKNIKGSTYFQKLTLQCTSLLETYAATPVLGHPNISRGSIRLSSNVNGQIVEGWLRQFYFLFIGYLVKQGLDDIEDEEIICPPGMVPIMTIHQAKGLQFPFVFVGHANSDTWISESHHLEDLLGQFPINPARVFVRPTANERAQLDLIRQFFVAYSRPEYALLIMGTRPQLRQGRIPCGPTKDWLRHKVLPL